MAKVTTRKETGRLVIDFTYQGVRCREQTALNDTAQNRKRLESIVVSIKKALSEGTFDYSQYFPQSPMVRRFVKSNEGIAIQGGGDSHAANSSEVGPTFSDFAETWFNERCIEWRRSHIKSLRSTLDGRLIPAFGKKVVSSITKSDVLEFRATLAKVEGRGRRIGLSPKRINEIIGLLRQILEEAADRFQFKSPLHGIKKLKVRKNDIAPFSLDEVQRIIATVRVDFKNYFVVRFFTGMRTGEVHGLKWKYIDFDKRLILVRETFVLGEDEYTKTDFSQRDIQMSTPVWEALKHQYDHRNEASEYVFCNLEGHPLDNKNFTDRIWYPLLRHLDLEERRPYQMRHTAATLWLASGEAPEWIARQLGHANTTMLFSVYSRYVPNLTRNDGSAMDRLLASRLSQGPLVEVKGEQGVYVPVHQTAPQPIPKRRGVYGTPRKPAKQRHDPSDLDGIEIPGFDLPIPVLKTEDEAAEEDTAPDASHDAQAPPMPAHSALARWMQSHPPTLAA